MSQTNRPERVRLKSIFHPSDFSSSRKIFRSDVFLINSRAYKRSPSCRQPWRGAGAVIDGALQCGQCLDSMSWSITTISPFRGNGGGRCNAHLHSFPAAEGRKSSLDDAVMMTILLLRGAALRHQGSPKERRQTEGQLDMCTQG